MAERNPKPEARKVERALPAWATLFLVRNGNRFRTSDFGLLSDFGFRISEFWFNHVTLFAMPLPSFLRIQDNNVLLALKLQPRASRTEIDKPYGDELKIKVTAPAVDSAAN